MTIFINFISVLINTIPHKGLLFLSRATGFLFCNLIPFRKEIIKENLALAFPEKSKLEINELVLKNYQHYIQVLFEILQSVRWKKEDYLRKVIRVNWSEIERYGKEKKGAIVLTSHLGNWEFAIGVAAAAGLPVDIIVKAAKNPYAQKILSWYRSKTGAGIFLESETAKDTLRSLSNGRCVAFILDQFMGPPIGLPVKFFGKAAGTAAGLALISEKKGVPVFPAYSYRDQQGNIKIVFEAPLKFDNLSEDKIERMYQKTQIFNDVLETQIRKHPEQWLWIHRRWKPFKGESRWIMKSKLAYAGIVLAFCLLGCAAKETTSQTGIALPPDANITIPQFSGQSKDFEKGETIEGDPLIVNPAVAPVPTPTPLSKKQIATKKKKGVEPNKMENEIKEKAPLKSDVHSFDTVPSDKVPFEVGERLEMNLSWLAIPAGRAVLEVREGPSFNGRPTFQLWANALSSKVVDAIYHVDNTIESFVDKQGLFPYKFLLHMLESKQKKETRVSFDHANKRAYYWAKRISERWGDQAIDRIDPFVPEGRDMFSALYYARALNYTLNKKQSFMVYENGANWKVELLPVAMELVNSSVGAFHCFKILVSVTLNNVLKPTGDIYMWLSDDSKKYIVKFDAKIKIGSLLGTLTSIREH